MTEELLGKPPVPVDPSRVSQDLGCQECSYNLRGLARDGRCPECGCPVVRSLDAGSGLRRATTAIRWAAWSGMASIASVVLLPSAGYVVGFSLAKPVVLACMAALWLVPMAVAGAMWIATRKFLLTGPLAHSAEFGPKHFNWRFAVVAAIVTDAALLGVSLNDIDSVVRRPIFGWMLTLVYLWMPALTAILFCSPARQLGNAARMDRKANWFRSVSRMVVIGAVGLPLAVQLVPQDIGRSDIPPLLLATVVATPAGFLLVGAFYFVAAGFWLAKALHELPPMERTSGPVSPDMSAMADALHSLPTSGEASEPAATGLYKKVT